MGMLGGRLRFGGGGGLSCLWGDPILFFFLVKFSMSFGEYRMAWDGME